MAFHGEVDIPSKDLTLPGFPNATACQLHTLQYKYDWTEEQLYWVRKNWIHDQDDFYLKPDSPNAKTGTLKGSHEEEDKDLLKTTLKNEVRNSPIRKKSWEELGPNVDEESPYIPKYKIIKENQ